MIFANLADVIERLGAVEAQTTTIVGDIRCGHCGYIYRANAAAADVDEHCRLSHPGQPLKVRVIHTPVWDGIVVNVVKQPA